MIEVYLAGAIVVLLGWLLVEVRVTRRVLAARQQAAVDHVVHCLSTLDDTTRGNLEAVGETLDGRIRELVDLLGHAFADLIQQLPQEEQGDDC